jgi:hypothetical protein
MPAVNPTRLRFQIEGLLSFFDSPEEFHSRLQVFFNSYANHTLKFGEFSPTKPLIPMYHLPDPVIRQLQFDIVPLIRSNPPAALTLAEELWQDNYYEIAQLAIFVLGHTPVNDPQETSLRLNKWLTPGMDQTLSSYLFAEGTRELQSAYPAEWEAFIQNYLMENDPKLINLGLQGLAEGLKNRSFGNLPAIFRLISPFLRDMKPEMTRAMENLLSVLIQTSPQETVFFLKQSLSLALDSPLTKRLVKAVLPSLPSSLQIDLKSALNK